MSNRVEERFSELKKEKKKAFIVYLTCGYPTLEVTRELILAFAKDGVDVIELGVPFSDPLADGPTIQASSERALKEGVNLEKIFNLTLSLRKETEIPLVIMSYYNPIFTYTLQKFISCSRKVGLDGVIIPDLPPEEGKGLFEELQRAKLVNILLAAPTTSLERAKVIASLSRGFLYYVSLTGVTGAREKLPFKIKKSLQALRKKTSLPICVGFGISKPEQIRQFLEVADGVVIGSAIIDVIRKHESTGKLIPQVREFTQTLLKEVKRYV
jgi:tryptophan synthase alpha chain